MKLPLLLIVALSLASSVLGAVAPELPKETADPRLDQKITYETDAKKLPEVLAEIGQKTGVRLGVAAGARFWSVRQRKVTLYLKDMPLREFMAQLEKLLDYHFSRSGKPGAYTYALWQDLNGRSKEKIDLEAKKELREKHRRRAIDETLRDTELAVMMTPDQAKAIKDKNPWLAYLAGTDRGRAYSQLLQSIPREKFDGLLQDNGFGFDLKLEDLSPSGQEALKKIGSLIDYAKINKLLDRGNVGDSGTLTKIYIHNPVWGEDDYETTPAAPFWLSICGRSGDKDENTCDLDTFLVTRTDVPMDDLRVTPLMLNEDEMAARSALSEKLRQPERDQAKRDVDLDKTAEYGSLKPAKGQTAISFHLQELAEFFGCNVMYECYPVGGSGMSTYDGQTTLGQALHELTIEDHVDWTKTGSTIRVRHSNWAERRSWEIPVDWVTAWQSVIEKKQQLDFDTLVDIVTKMTDTQLKHNFTYGNPPSSSIDDPLVAELFAEAGAGRASTFRNLTELYARLTPSQKNKMWSKEGLPFNEIADDPLFKGEAPTLGRAPAYDCTFRIFEGIAKPPAITVGDKSVDMNGRGETLIPRPVGKSVNIELTMAVWLKDISPQDHAEEFIKMLTPEMLADAQNEPIRLSHSSPLWEPPTDRLKSLIDRIKKAREEKAKQAQGRTSP